MKQKTKLIIFDLDGVIIDSKKNMNYAWNYVKKKHSLKIEFNEYFKNIGLPFEKILLKLGIKKEQRKIFLSYSNESIKQIKEINLFKGVKQVLKNLDKNYYLAILTSKDFNRTKIILKKFKLDFKYICCPIKGKKGKPNPWQITKLMKKLKIHRNNVFYVGDTQVDKRTAKNAGIKFIYAKYGYENIRSTKYTINSMKEINKFL